MNKFFLIITLLTLFVSCNTTKKTSTSNSSTNSTSYKKLLSGLSDDYPDYKSMASDIRLQAKIEGTSYRATGLVRHVRDKGLFISVKKLGFEIGQVLITKDSFFVLNRWEKEYIQEPISIIEKEYNIRGEFGMVEEPLTGIPQFNNYKKNDKSMIEDENHRLELPSLYENIDLILWLRPIYNDVVQAYYQDNLNRGVRMKYEPERKNKMVLKRELHTENIDDEVHISLEYKNPSFNKSKLPTFNIPSHYSRRHM